MEPIFVEFIDNDDCNVSINVSNIIQVKEVEIGITEISCIGIVITVKEVWETVMANIATAIYDAKQEI